jgi:hypothetical protein
LSESNPPAEFGGLKPYLAVLLGLAAVSLLLGFMGVPIPLIPIFTIVVTGIFVIAPFFGLYLGASAAACRVGSSQVPWAALLLLLGVVGHVGSIALLQYGLVSGLVAALTAVIGQAGLITWCLGLGGLLGLLVKDKNMLIPIAVFLALFDAFLVLTPVGLTKQVMEKHPQVQQSVSLVIPKVVEAPTSGPVAPLAYIGPADLLFAAMFFTVLFRQGMRTRATLAWLGPVLVLYLAGALLLGPLPALVPIGLCVLLVNWREFNLNKEEWLSTGVVAALGIGLLTWGMTRPRPQAEPLPKEPVLGAQGSGGSPPPALPGQRRS